MKKAPAPNQPAFKTSPTLVALAVAAAALLIKQCLFSPEPVANRNDLLCSKANDIIVCTDKKLKLFSGTVVVNNGEFVREVTHYKNGKPDGNSKIYYNGGQLQGEYSYRNGVLNGSSTSYFFNGNPQEEAHYKGGVLHGSYKTYYDNGQPEFSATFQNGEIVGAAKFYYQNGNLMLDSFVKDGIFVEENCYTIYGEDTDCEEIKEILNRRF